MKTNISIFAILSIILLLGCKKPDAPTIKNKKSPIEYFRISNADGLLVSSFSTNHARGPVIRPSSGLYVDSTLSAIYDEIFCYFPGSGEGSLLNAGAITYNGHSISESNDFSYYMLTAYDTFLFNTTSSFSTNWHVAGATVPGFSDTYTSNNFPSAFTLVVFDTLIPISGGYIINLNVGSGLTNADSIVWNIYDVNNSSNNVYKVTSASTVTCTFSPTDLAIFSSSKVIAIDVLAYNYRHVVKNGTENIYFITQTRVTNDVIKVTS